MLPKMQNSDCKKRSKFAYKITTKFIRF